MEQEQDFTLDQIIEQSFDFSDYSESEKEELIAETAGMILETSLLRALDDAGEEMQETFTKFIEDEPNEEKMTSFIQENFPKFGDIVIDEIKNFKEMGGGLETTDKEK